MEIAPQPGPQERFLSIEADIIIYGGAAGGGKTYSLLLEPLRHFYNPQFNGVIFRRTTPQITNPGAIWDESLNLYSAFGSSPNISSLTHVFPTGMSIKFAHMEHEKNMFDWQGSQVAYIGFDEVTHFTEKQFFYMLSRNRSTSGARSYVRATCNPDQASWLRRFLDWWIGPDGYPMSDRDGVLRWFVRQNNEIVWANTKEDLIRRFGSEALPKSVTFIASKLSDNKILEQKDPGYRANLEALSLVDRRRLLDGNWNVKPSAGDYFKRRWFEVVDALPADLVQSIRCWDKAASEKPEADFTAGVLMHKSKEGYFYISDVVRGQWTPGKVKATILNTASQDGKRVMVGLKQDPGQAGVYEKDDYTKALAGYMIKVERETKDKQTRAKPFSAQCEAGNVKLVRGPWVETFLDELESFPEMDIDDQVDAASGAFNLLTGGAVAAFNKDHARKSGSKFVKNEDY